jgi:D-amino-acid dehydrogenase
VYPVKGYSLTVPLVDEARAALDRDGRDLQGGHHAFDRIRVGGMAELAGSTCA